MWGLFPKPCGFGEEVLFLVGFRVVVSQLLQGCLVQLVLVVVFRVVGRRIKTLSNDLRV